MTEETKKEIVKEKENKKETSPIMISKKKLLAIFIVGVLLGFMLGRTTPSNNTAASMKIAAKTASGTTIIASETITPAANPVTPAAVVAPASSPAMPDGK